MGWFNKTSSMALTFHVFYLLGFATLVTLIVTQITFPILTVPKCQFLSLNYRRAKQLALK